MSEVYVAILWHQHQPYYKNAGTGLYVMPWLRLHAVKDYYGMAALIEECPGMKATINFVPSALLQIRDYLENNAQDTNLIVSRKPAADLTDEDRLFMLKNFFMANYDHMIAPYPRYRELYQKARPDERDRKAALRRLNPKEWLDLQVWANLTWFHPLSVERSPELKQLFEKDRNFTEDEKRRVLDLQLDVMRQVIPLHRKLQDRGQIELSTTPFYHPILPLLNDPSCAREAMPNTPLPKSWVKLPEDARAQIEKGIRYYEECFGVKPRGMWPSEGSVSQEVASLFAEQGIRWIATDEEILAKSIGEGIARSPSGEVMKPGVLYKPYLAGSDHAQLAIVFRDHVLSDLIGFHYQGHTAEHAVSDLIGRLERVGERADGAKPLVSIILDGENAWEFYRNQGVDFLRGLYQRLEKHPRLRPVRIEDAVAMLKPRDRVGRLFPGSWISHNFYIWIGHSEDVRAWELVYATRQWLVEKAKGRPADDPALARAWEEIYAAEGSDWFWWYGDDHVTAQIEEFDTLFRAHLKGVYEALGETPPLELDTPVTRAMVRRPYTEPRAFLPVTVDGRSTGYFEWVNAGRCDLQVAGAMSRSTDQILSRLLFGFDAHRVYLRLDGKKSLRKEMPANACVRVIFAGHTSQVVSITAIAEGKPKIEIQRAGVVTPCTGAECPGIECALGGIFELALPFHALGFKPEMAVDFYIEVCSEGRVVERAPAGGAIRLEVPLPDFERIQWQV